MSITEISPDGFVLQALATAMNYYHTGRHAKAIEVVIQARKVGLQIELADLIFSQIAFGDLPTKQIKDFTGRWWYGESLEGKSIEVFCDQGMGDTIQCLRYLQLMKERWNCRIILNCYAYFAEMNRLMDIPCIDQFVQIHVPCDYFTNILSLPTMLSGIERDIHYPGCWQQVLNCVVPPQPILKVKPKEHSEKTFRVGLAYQSNALNVELAVKKSIPIMEFATLEDGVNELWSISPDAERCNFMIQPRLEDLMDTAALISSFDAIVSVDTVTLHLAGTLGVRTFGMLPYEADARWGIELSTPWYPSVELYRQNENMGWEEAIKEIKGRLACIRNMN